MALSRRSGFSAWGAALLVVGLFQPRAHAQFEEAVVIVSTRITDTSEPVPFPVVGRSADIRVTFFGSPPESATLFHRPTGSNGSYARIDGVVSADDPQTFEGQLGGGALQLAGLDVYVTYVRDGVTETIPENTPQQTPLHLPVILVRQPAEVRLTPRQYSMIAIPVAFAEGLEEYGVSVNGTVDGVLGDDDGYGAYDPDVWRILRWDPLLDAYREGPAEVGAFEPGRAFWLIQSRGDEFDVEGGVTPGFVFEPDSLPAEEPVRVVLEPGWNQVGNPFDYPFAWTSLATAGLVEEPMAFDGTSYAPVDVLEPWTGYFVYNPGQAAVTLEFLPGATVAGERMPFVARHLARMGEGAYLVRLGAEAEGSRYRDAAFLGLSTAAAPGRDLLDRAKAPPVEDGLRLRVAEVGQGLAVSVRPPTSQTWDLTLDVGEAAGHRPVAVALAEYGLRPLGTQLFVQDLTRGTALDVREGRFRVPAAEGEVRLRVILGDLAYAEAQAGEVPLWPEAPALAAPYPNPLMSGAGARFEYRVARSGPVQLVLYDALGRTVQRIERVAPAAGWHAVEWDGRDALGARLASGLYVAVLRAPGGTATQKLTLFR